jgi:predicted ATPase
MESAINRISLSGFKSIQGLHGFPLLKLNVLIGANGAGKSNFVDFFRMLRALATGTFQRFIIDAGGGDGFLFMGPKTTATIEAQIAFGMGAYSFSLKPTASGTLQVIEERMGSDDRIVSAASGTLESLLWSKNENRRRSLPNPAADGGFVYDTVTGWTVYHFHDTSPLAPMRRDQSLRDTQRFRDDALNIAPYLLHLKQKESGSYVLIRDTVRLVAPFFDDFLLRPQSKGTNELVRLEWQQKGSDFPFQPNQLSDGTIRFICLATALLQPNPPATIVIDEPELGLHPYAISLLADLIKSAAERTQVIISTQSATLLDYFDPEQVIVVNRRDGRSTFERLDKQALAEWLDDYSVGELWQKNVVQGGPARE